MTKKTTRKKTATKKAITKKTGSKTASRKKKAAQKAIANITAGQPTRYSSGMNETAYKLALLNCTDKEIAGILEISKRTLDHWKKKYPKFLHSIKDGKENADANVADRLYQRAMGYTHPEEKIFQHDGEIIRANTLKHYPPDTQAASLWLRNRQPDKWRDKTEHVITEPEKEKRSAKEVQERITELDKKLKELEAQL